MRNGQNDFEAAVPGPLPYSSNPQMMRWKVPASFSRVTFVPRQRERVCVVVGGWGVGGCKARDGRARAMSARKGRRRQNRGCSDSLFSGLAIFGSVMLLLHPRSFSCTARQSFGPCLLLALSTPCACGSACGSLPSPESADMAELSFRASTCATGSCRAGSHPHHGCSAWSKSTGPGPENGAGAGRGGARGCAWGGGGGGQAPFRSQGSRRA